MRLWYIPCTYGTGTTVFMIDVAAASYGDACHGCQIAGYTPIRNVPVTSAIYLTAA